MSFFKIVPPYDNVVDDHWSFKIYKNNYSSVLTDKTLKRF